MHFQSSQISPLGCDNQLGNSWPTKLKDLKSKQLFYCTKNIITTESYQKEHVQTQPAHLPNHQSGVSSQKTLLICTWKPTKLYQNPRQGQLRSQFKQPSCKWLQSKMSILWICQKDYLSLAITGRKLQGQRIPVTIEQLLFLAWICCITAGILLPMAWWTLVTSNVKCSNHTISCKTRKKLNHLAARSRHNWRAVQKMCNCIMVNWQ